MQRNLLVFQASGPVGEPARRVTVQAFPREPDAKGASGHPAMLSVGEVGSEDPAFRRKGRLFGLGEDRAVTFSLKVGEERGRPTFGDVLRVVSDAGGKLVGQLYPPNAAAQLGVLHQTLRETAPGWRNAVRQEIARLEIAYGQAVTLDVELGAHLVGRPQQPSSAPDIVPGRGLAAR